MADFLAFFPDLAMYDVGLLNRYTVNPVSWVRIPSPPPPKYLIMQEFPSRRPGFEIARHLRRFAAMRVGALSGETAFRRL